MKLRFGAPDRDKKIMRLFLKRNYSNRVLQLNGVRADQMLPGGAFLLDSLIYDAGFSRYCVPSRRYLQDFTRARSVDEDSLHRVIIF